MKDKWEFDFIEKANHNLSFSLLSIKAKGNFNHSKEKFALPYFGHETMLWYIFWAHCECSTKIFMHIFVHIMPTTKQAKQSLPIIYTFPMCHACILTSVGLINYQIHLPIIGGRLLLN